MNCFIFHRPVKDGNIEKKKNPPFEGGFFGVDELFHTPPCVLERESNILIDYNYLLKRKIYMIDEKEPFDLSEAEIPQSAGQSDRSQEIISDELSELREKKRKELLERHGNWFDKNITSLVEKHRGAAVALGLVGTLVFSQVTRETVGIIPAVIIAFGSVNLLSWMLKRAEERKRENNEVNE